MTLGLAPYLGFPNVFGYNTPFDATIEWFILVHFWSKFLDMLDTVFIVLRRRNRQLSFLHVYHHATIGPLWGLALYEGMANGTAYFGAFCNSFVHVVMYSH